MMVKKLLIVCFISIILICNINGKEGGGDTGASKPELKFVRSFIVKQKLFGDQTSQIYTIRDQKKMNRGVFRRPPRSRKQGFKWMPVDLIYVQPGGLENPSAGEYTLAVEDDLGVKYDNSTFSFSGRADALVYLNEIGWGTVNNNGDFIPLLISEEYEDIEEPTYEFMWSERERDLGPGGTIYLNYMMKIPKQSKTMWGTELGIGFQNFASNFSVNSPKIRANAVVRWRHNIFQEFRPELRQAEITKNWQLPYTLEVNGFALAEDFKTIFTATANAEITAWDTTGKKLWKTNGKAPIIRYKEYLFTVSDNYRNLNILDNKTGQMVARSALPKHLPKTGNSFAMFSCKSEPYIILNIPDQSRMLLYLFSDHF